MVFRPLAISGAFAVEIDPRHDERGFFARTWSAEEFEAHGLNPALVQVSISFNPRRHTLRGMHFQTAPFAEAKLVRCTRGSIFDVAIDLRPNSPTYRQHCALTLTGENRAALYVPEGCAHGFLTLSDAAEVLYQISTEYSAEHAAGVRWNDPAFAVPWPAKPECISERDRSYPDFAP
ncbi:MAG TPA: dTDP-4-dehydrorhamnose 3,5-epimerase [Candidatus Dormibacteraeota bacterium]